METMDPSFRMGKAGHRSTPKPHRLALSYRTDSIAADDSHYARRSARAQANRRILVPVECDERSKRLLHRASTFARDFGAELTLLHVYEGMNYAPAHTTPQQLHRLNKAMHSAAVTKLTHLKAELIDDPKVGSAQLIVACGHLQEEVFKAAKSKGADLILVSTHAYSRVRHLFLGSRAESILHCSSCPVVVMPDIC